VLGGAAAESKLNVRIDFLFVQFDRSKGYQVGINFPAVWTDPGFRGVLPRGTPIAQCCPVPRAAPTLVCEAMGDAQLQACDALAAQIMGGPGVYRKDYRSKRGPG